MNTQSAKFPKNTPFASFFNRKISRGPTRCKAIFPNAPTPPHRPEVGLQPPPVVDIVSGIPRSVTDNAMYSFNAILLKIQLSLSEFKRQKLHSRLHHFASFFFKIFTIPSLKEKFRFMYPPHQRFYDNEILQKKKMNTQSAKFPKNTPFASFFNRKISRGPTRCKAIFPNAPTPPHRPEVGLQPPPVVDLVSGIPGSVTDNAMYSRFNAILLKIQLSLSEFKRQKLHSRLHHFASFFQKKSHQREGTPLPYPPHSALRASRKPPQVEFWIHHCKVPDSNLYSV